MTGGFSRSRPRTKLRWALLDGLPASTGHTQLPGYFNAFDRAVAEAAFEIAEDSGTFPDPISLFRALLRKVGEANLS